MNYFLSNNSVEKVCYHFLNNGYTDSLLANSQQACGWSGIEGEIWSNYVQQHSRVQYRGGLDVCWSNTRVGNGALL